MTLRDYSQIEGIGGLINYRFYSCCILAILGSLFFVSCGAGIDSQRKESIARMQKAVIGNPADMNSVRELGILYYENADYNKSRALLFKVISQNSDDLRARSYLGLTYEAMGKDGQAAKLYNAAINSDSPYEDWLLGRSQILKRKQARTLLRSRVEEIRNSDADLKKHSVVVAPVTYHGKKGKYESLAIGITAMFNHALGKVNTLKVADQYNVELVSGIIQAQSDSKLRENPVSILGEVFYSQTVIKCNFDIVDDRQIVLDVGYWNLNSEGLPTTKTYLAPLDGGLAVIRQDVVADLLAFLEETEEQPFFVGRIDKNAFSSFCEGIRSYLDNDFADGVDQFEAALKDDPGFELCAFYKNQNEKLLNASKTPAEIGLNSTPISPGIGEAQDQTFRRLQWAP